MRATGNAMEPIFFDGAVRAQVRKGPMERIIPMNDSYE
jgi:hypothetical protein